MSDFTSSSGIPYEHTVAEQKTKLFTLKCASLVAFYILWSAALLLIGLWLQLPIAFVALVPLSLWPIVSLTWRWTRIEYEYSYFDGTLTVSRVLGGKSRKVLCEVVIKSLTAVYPCEEEYIARAEQYGANKIVMAASSTDATDLCVALWCDENDTKYALYFEPNDRAVRILRDENYIATTALRK